MNETKILLIALLLITLIGCVPQLPTCEVHKVCYVYGNGWRNDMPISCSKEWAYYRYEAINQFNEKGNKVCNDETTYERFYD
jgi:hypothetical protein